MDFITPESLAGSGDHFDQRSWVVVLSKAGLLSLSLGENWQPLTGEAWKTLEPKLKISDENLHLLGHIDGRSCYSIYLEQEQTQSELQWFGLRQILGLVSAPLFELANRASQVSQWDRNHRYCGACGTATYYHRRDRARCCSRCGSVSYPRISPCIIVLVRKGESCLLARNARTGSPMFSVLAGFVEAGETAEQCVHREVFEEAGIKITNLQYISSQAWPFPGQLMLAFSADFLSGMLKPALDELADAAWYHYQDLPLIPPVSTVSGQLIEQFCQEFD